MPYIDPQMSAVMKKSSELTARFSFADTPLSRARELYALERRFWNSGGPKISCIMETKVKGPVGQIPIRIYHPQPGKLLSVLVYMHGGGYVVGSIETHDGIMRELAFRSGCAVVGVEYSLSPEQKFPVALEETQSVLEWLQRISSNKQARVYGLESDNIVLGGDSAGASLSIGTALNCENRLCGLLLYYGSYGLRDSCSSRLYGGKDDGMGEKDRDFYLKSYLRSEKDLSDLRLDVLRGSMQKMPSTCLISAEMDPFRDDSLALAFMLEQSGVPVDHYLHKGVLHGFLHYSRMLDAAVIALDQGADFLKMCFQKNL